MFRYYLLQTTSWMFSEMKFGKNNIFCRPMASLGQRRSADQKYPEIRGLWLWWWCATVFLFFYFRSLLACQAVCNKPHDLIYVLLKWENLFLGAALVQKKSDLFSSWDNRSQSNQSKLLKKSLKIWLTFDQMLIKFLDFFWATLIDSIDFDCLRKKKGQIFSAPRQHPRRDSLILVTHKLSHVVCCIQLGTLAESESRKKEKQWRTTITITALEFQDIFGRHFCADLSWP